MDPHHSSTGLCLRTLNEHTGRVFRLQFDDFQIVSSSHDDTILIWDFLNVENASSQPAIASGASSQSNANAAGGGGNGAAQQANNNRLRAPGNNNNNVDDNGVINLNED